MPTVLRKLAPHRRAVLSDAQRSHLWSGCYVLPFGPEFDDEAHRREAWAAHREELLAAYDRPGHRPAAMWDYDVPGGWRKYGASEQEVVYRLITTGELEPCVPNEIAQIERDWLHSIQMDIFAHHYQLRTLKEPLPTWGCPGWFYDKHAAKVLRRMLAERGRPVQLSDADT
jgi:hypothetical protein